MNHAIPPGSILKTPSKHELVKAGELDPSDDFDLYPSSALPMMVARRLVDELFTTIGGHETLGLLHDQVTTEQPNQMVGLEGCTP